MNIWKSILQSYLFVVIGGDTYNKIFVYEMKKKNSQSDFFHTELESQKFS